MVLLLLYLLGCFTHPDRVALCRELQSRQEASGTTQAARMMLQHFAVPAEAITLADTLRLIGPTYERGGSSLTTSGVVDLYAKDGSIQTVGDLAEVRAWAYNTSPLYPALSFALVLLGLVIDTLATFLPTPCP